MTERAGGRRVVRPWSWLPWALALGLAPLQAKPIDNGTGPITAVELFVEATTEQAIGRYQRGAPLVLPPADAAWRPATLPVHFVRNDLGAGEPRWRRAWYRVRYEVPPRIEGRLAIYVPRFMGGFGDVDYLIDGRVVDFAERDRSDQWNHPFYTLVPREVQQQGRFELLISVWYEEQAGYMLAAPRIGPAELLATTADIRRFLQTKAPEAMSYAFLVLGLFAFGFWLRRRREVTYLLFALSTVVWVVRTMHYYTQVPTALIVPFWWLSLNALSWLMLLVYAFALRFQRQSARWAEWTLLGIVVLTAVLTVPALGLDYSAQATIAYTSQLVVSLTVTGLLTRDAFRQRVVETRMLALAIWINLAFGVHDLLLFTFRVGPESLFLMPYGALFLFGSFLFAVTRRYAAAIETVESANAQLEARLRERTRELEASYEALRRVEKERAVGDERQRLMREMHDGLGSSLMSSLVMVEQGRLAPGDVATVLRECIDDLKLTIDSLEPIGQDLLTLLATLRYRLGRRLELAGLRLDWRVGELPPLPWLDAVNALQVLRIVQEALTNVVKHSGAARVSIETLQRGHEVLVRIEDDGCGMPGADAAPRSGRGLANMMRRAEQLGGSVELRAGEAGRGTCVTLSLPVDRRQRSRDDGAAAPGPLTTAATPPSRARSAPTPPASGPR